MRLAIYARFSDDTQDPRSIDDQVRLCRDHAERQQLGTVVAVYADYAMTGASLRTRPEATRLMADARAGAFDAVLIEALDRISRDQEDIAAIFKRLGFAGVKLLSVGEGEIGELHIGLKGTMNALFLKDLAAKVRRGQSGRAAAGSIPGGKAYGYRVVRELDVRGELVRGKRAIDETEAAVVRRIYAEYIAGSSPRTIAIGLNRDGVASPFGGQWNGTSIAGGRGRASGILWNGIYVGRLVYNRTRFLRDPETGRRISRPNPPDMWVTAAVPELAIIDPDTFTAAQQRHARHADGPLHKRRRPRHVFSGLLRCGVCGGNITVRQSDRLGCATRHERGPNACANASTILIASLEARVIGGLHRQLLDPAAIAAYIDEYHRARAAARSADRRRQTDLERKLAKLTGELDRLIDAVAQGHLAAERVGERSFALEDERRQLSSELEALREPPEVVTMHPRMVERYKARIADLVATISTAAEPGAEASRLAAIGILREFVDHIEIGSAAAPRMPPPVTAYGLLPRVLQYATQRQQNRNLVMKSLVAGEGLALSRHAVAIAC